MREIKFRAWDESTKTMHYPYTDYGGFGGQSSGDILNRFDNVMQFTGIQDKNGKEIWEGDILRSVYGENGNVAGFVFYRAFEFVCMRKSKKSWHDFGCVVGEEGEIYEVIGNIYSNPELLK